MAVLLYDRIDLEERVQKSYNLWKGCHIISYLLAGIFGVLNCYFLFETMRTFEDRCVLDPHQLVFHDVAPPTTSVPLETTTEILEVANLTAVNETTSKLMLDIPASRFHLWEYCDLPLSAPLVAAVVALVWGAMFATCPAGGHSKRGLVEPWRILVPALLFSLVFLVFTAYNFHRTDSGLQAFCAQFHNVTNTTSCTRAMDEHISSASSLAPSAGIMLARAACAGMFACWLVAAALLLARCVGGADFAVHRTEVSLHRETNANSQPTAEDVERATTSGVQTYHDQLDTSTSEQVSLTSEPTLSSQVTTARELQP